MSRSSRTRITGGPARHLFVLLAMAGCAAPSQSPPGAETPSLPAPAPGVPVRADGPSFRALQRAAADQAKSPDRASQTLALPPGLDAADVDQITDAPGSTARLTLEEALAQFPGPLPESQTPARTEPPSEESRRQALRLYASARSRLFRGDSGGAIVDLESATRLDPMAPAPWRELGEVQLQQGKRLLAAHSFEESVRRGNRETRTLWHLGRDALRAGRAKQAMLYFASARSQDQDSDPALPSLINTDLADALAQLGYLRASTQALANGLALPDQVGSTRLRVELGELLRRRSDLWRDLGDGLSRLGDHGAALDAYGQSQQLPTFDPSALVPRQIYALMRLGRPADAALLLVAQIQDSQGSADQRVLALIPYVASSGAVAKDLAGAIGELAETFRQGVSATVADRLVRAQAAAVPPAQARPILRRHIALNLPSASGSATLSQLLATYDPHDTSGAARELLGLIEQTPTNAPACAAALLNSPVDLDGVLAALPAKGGTDAEVLLRACLLSSIGFQAGGADLVTDRTWGGHSAAAGAFIETVLNAQVGRWDRARSAFAREALAPATPDLARLRAQAALGLQQPQEAMEALKPLVAPAPGVAPPRVVDLIEAGRLSVQSDDGAGAEGFFKRATEVDPFDERGYDGLIRLYLPGGLLADNAKVNDAVRALRESCPSSRSLRVNAAEEMAQRQFDSQAEQMLLDLADEDLSDLGVGSMLLSLWERRAQAAKTAAAKDLEKPRFERAENWLRERISRRPEQPWLWAGLARVVAAQGRAEEAVSILAGRLAVRPFPALAQVREAILRDPLDRADEADRLALERLEPAPRSLEASLELADLYIRLKRTPEGAALVQESIPPGIKLTDSQTARLVFMLMRASQGNQGTPADADGAAALFDAVVARAASLPAQLHETRLTMLASHSHFDDRALAAAVDLAARQHPALAVAFYTRVADVLVKSNDRARQAAALPYLRLAIEKSATPSTELLWKLFSSTVIAGTAQDLDLLLEQLRQPDQITSLLRATFASGRPVPTDPEKLRAELAYFIGGSYASFEKRDLADRAYTAALRFDPGHAWAKNDWGYMLLEQGRDLERAARMLEEAYAALPEESSVIDSLAWLRYKQGLVSDQIGPDGQVRVQGAVALLERAAATEKGASNVTIQDHLGDALWVAGEREQAAKAWAQASAIAQAELAKPQATRAAEETAKTLQAILRKQRSLADGNEPDVAPRASDR